MTTQTMLQRVYDIKTALYGLDPNAAETVEKTLNKGIQVEAGNGIFVFELVALINELKEELRKEDAKASGKSTQRKALQRILKHAAVASPSREFLQYPFMSNGKQWFLSSVHAVGLYAPIDWCKCGAEKDSPDMARIAVKRGEEIELPDLADLKAYIRIKKIEKERRIVYSYGDFVLDAQQLVDVLEALPGAKMYHDRSKYATAYFEHPDGIGLICPLHMQAGDEIPTVLKERRRAMQEKLVIVVRGGMIESVFAKNPNQFDVEILDFDVQDEDELRVNEDRLTTIEQYLAKQEV